MTVDLKSYAFRRGLSAKRNLEYRLSKFIEARALFERFGIAIDDVAYAGFAHTARMLARRSDETVLVYDFAVATGAKPSIAFTVQRVTIDHGHVVKDGPLHRIVSYDGFELVEPKEES